MLGEVVKHKVGNDWDQAQPGGAPLRHLAIELCSWIIEVRLGHSLLQLFIRGSNFNWYLVRSAWSNLFQFPNKMPMKTNDKIIETHIIQDEKTVNWLPEPVGNFSPNKSMWWDPASYLSAYSFLHLETKQTLFQKRKDGTFSHCYLLRNLRRMVPTRKLNIKTAIEFWISQRAIPPPLAHASSLSSPLSPVGAPQTPRGWGMGNQDRSHYILRNTASTISYSTSVAPVLDPLPSFVNHPVVLCGIWLSPPFTTSCPRPLPPCGTCVNNCGRIRLFNSTLTFSQLSFHPKARESYGLEGYDFKRCWLLTLVEMGSWSLHQFWGQGTSSDLHFPDSLSRHSCCLPFGAWMGRQSLRLLLSQGGATNK